MNTFKAFALAATATAVMLVCGSARAQDVPSSEIRLQGVNLLDPAAVRGIKRHIRTSALHVCDQSGLEKQSYEWARCVNQAQTVALSALDRHIAAARPGKPTAIVMASPDKR